MLRRVNARLQIAKDRQVRHLRHIALIAVSVIFLPPIVVGILRMWWFCMTWLAS